jgi:predicted nicotinamide N-methyase
MTSKNYFGPPLNLGRDLFGGDSDEEDQNNNPNSEANLEPNPEDVLMESEEKLYEFPNNMMIKIREFSFHLTNANFVWKGNVKFADWILKNRENLFNNKRILEIASGKYISIIIIR